MKNVGTQQEFELRHRPHTVKEFFPSTDLSIFQEMVDQKTFPQRITLYGKPGLGKSTLARIVSSHILELDEQTTIDLVKQTANVSIPNFYEADFALNPRAEYASQVADIISAAISDGGLFGTSKYVFLLEEFTQLQGDTQKRLIKLISDHSLSNIFVIITTNNINKVESSMGDRQLDVYFHNPNENSSIDYIQAIAKRESVTLTREEAIRIFQASTGSYRSMSNNLWFYLSYGKLTSGSTEEDGSGAISKYFNILTQIYNMVWQSHFDSKNKNTIISLEVVDQTTFNALMNSITDIAMTKKSCRNTYEAFISYISNNIIKNGTYKKMSLAYDIMAEVERLKTSYDGNVTYELLKLSEAIIRARVKYNKDLDMYRLTMAETSTQTEEPHADS
jgi:DNA polymerase III delta prime subunit